MLTLASYPLRNLAITRDFATCLGSTGKRGCSQVRLGSGGTSQWGTKAFGADRWLGGWGVAVSAIIVLANVAEIAAIYTLRFFGLDDLAENPVIKVSLGIVFIAIMTYISCRRHRDH